MRHLFIMTMAMILAITTHAGVTLAFIIVVVYALVNLIEDRLKGSRFDY